MKKILLILFCMVLLTGTISALEFDNIKKLPDNFDYREDIITIRNSFLWIFPLGKVADIQLIENTDQCLVNCKTKFKVKLYSDYDNPLTREYFKDRRNKNIDVSGEWYYYENSSYEIEVNEYKGVCELDPKSINGSEICFQEKIGSHNETRYDSQWLKYEGGTFKEGEYEFEYRGQKPVKKDVDFKIVLFGVDLGKEYVWWNDSFGKKRELSNLTGEGTADIIKINIPYDSDMQTDFDDVRFLNSAEDAELGYYLEQKSDSNWAIFRIKSNNESSIYMYYNNSAVSTTSNITDVYGSGLISAWFLERTSGDVIDETGTNNGTNVGATRGVAGRLNNAFDFEADEDDYVNMGDKIDGIEEISIALWFKPESIIATERQFVSKDDETKGRSYDFSTTASGKVKLFLWDDGDVGYQTFTDDVVLSVGTWTHVIVTADVPTDTVKIYINGLEVEVNHALGPWTGTTIRDSTSILMIGRREYSGSEQPVDGIIDEIEIWDKVLSPAEALIVSNIQEPTYVLGDETVPNPITILNFPIDNYNSSSPIITFNGTVYDMLGNDIVNVSLIINGIYNETNYSGINNTDYIFIKTIEDGDYNWTYEACDNESQCKAATIRSLTIDATPPIINITYPLEKVNYHIINTNLSLNWTITDAHLDSCWYNYNGTNISLTCSDNHTNINTTEYSIRNITFYANDTFGNLNSDYHEWDYKIFEIQQTFSPITIEGSTETYINNIILGNGETITGVIIEYNGTDKSAGFLSLGENEYNFSSTFIVPSVAAEANVTFFWKITLISDQVNASSRFQTVRSIDIDDCSVFTNKIFNYTIIDEELQTKITNKTLLELNLEVFDKTKTVSILNFSKKYDNVNPALVCLSIDLTNGTVYAVDSTVKYEAYEAKNYSVEYYNIQNFQLQNSTIPQNINLFDLLLIDSTEFQITFKDSNFVAVENALIQINRQYVSENLFKTVEIPKTDSNGQTLAHLVEKDVVYNIIVLKEGEVLGTFNNIIAFCEDILIGSCFISLNALTIGEISFDYDEDIGLFYDFKYNETTRSLQFDFSTTDGSVKNITLSALKIDQLGNTTVCDGFLISSSGSIFCSVPVSIGNETIIVSVFVDGDLEITNYVRAGREFDIGDAGYFLMFFLVLSLALMMVQSKTGVIIGVILGFISGVLLSFIQGGLLGIGSSVIWLIIMGIILIYKLNKEGQT